MTSETVHPVPDGFDAKIGPEELEAIRERLASDPEGFWLDQAKRLDWARFPTKAGDWSFREEDFHIDWFADGQLNLSVNCLDRHLDKNGDRTALIFEADEPAEGRCRRRAARRARRRPTARARRPRSRPSRA